MDRKRRSARALSRTKWDALRRPFKPCSPRLTPPTLATASRSSLLTTSRPFRADWHARPNLGERSYGSVREEKLFVPIAVPHSPLDFTNMPLNHKVGFFALAKSTAVPV
jgi:hypothetical protein